MTRQTKLFFRRAGLVMMGLSVGLWVGQGFLPASAAQVTLLKWGTFELQAGFPMWTMLIGLMIFLAPFGHSFAQARGWVK